MNREDCAAAINHLVAAAISLERLYVATPADNIMLRTELALMRRDVNVCHTRLRKLQQEATS